MEGIILGQYVPGQSFLHRLDPRTKIITVAVIAWVIFLLKTLVDYVCFGVFLVALYFAAGIGKSLWKTIRPGIYLVFFTVILNTVFTPGETLARVGFLSFTKEGFVIGMTVGLRLLYLISLSSLLTLTTSPIRMTDGLELLMNPFRKIGFPASEIAMMMNIALRFVPTFWEEWEKIRKAQISRGADFESWNIGNRIKYMTAMLIPLFISGFRRADELSQAMEARGYVVGAPRTSLHILELYPRDYITMGLILPTSLGFAVNRMGLFF